MVDWERNEVKQGMLFLDGGMIMRLFDMKVSKAQYSLSNILTGKTKYFTPFGLSKLKICPIQKGDIWEIPMIANADLMVVEIVEIKYFEDDLMVKVGFRWYGTSMPVRWREFEDFVKNMIGYF
jgi:hypothetical protein